jgi:hypothetical protein
MSQLFHPSANGLSRLSLFGIAAALALVAWSLYTLNSSSYATGETVAREQPVQFSHKHHVGDEGFDCRYCHTSVENSAFAGIPPTKTCMNCHSQIWTNSPELEPVKASFRTGQSIAWTRVHDLPDFVYFDHSVHVAKGVGCTTCHGRIDRMPLTFQHANLQMSWCLDCHRNPAKYVRPRDRIFDVEYEPPANQLELGRKLVKEYKVQSLTSCSTCHR